MAIKGGGFFAFLGLVTFVFKTWVEIKEIIRWKHY